MSTTVDPAACLRKKVAKRFPSDCWHTVLGCLPRESLEACEMACRKLRALIAASHTHAESPLRRLNVHISSTISTFTVTIASAYNGANVSSAQTRETVPTLMQLLELCLRAHIIVEQFTVVPEAAEKLAFHSGRRCKNIRLEARVVQLKIPQLPFSGTRGRANFVSMFNRLEAIAGYEADYLVQLSGDDLRMFAVSDVSGVYMSPRIDRPFIETPDILCFLFDRVGPGEDVHLQLRRQETDIKLKSSVL